MSATSALMIEWGTPIEGREMKALEEFMTHVSWWTELKQKGSIADFRIYGPVTGNFNRAGFAIIEGSDAQIETLRNSDEFRTHLNHVFLIGHNIQVNILEMGDAMMTRMQRYGKAVKERL